MKPGELWISIWGCSTTRQIRIMRHLEHSTPKEVMRIKIRGKMPTKTELECAEKVMATLQDKPCADCGGSGILADPNKFGEPDQNTIKMCECLA